MPEQSLLQTGDGSHTLVHDELEETYHSKHGAITESKHVFIENGLHCISKDKSVIRIFEMGFGTGLNALLSLFEAMDKKLMIIYHAIEKYPVKQDIVEMLNYPDLMNHQHQKYWFYQLHQCEWGQPVVLNQYFTLHKIDGDLHNWSPQQQIYDMIFLDAFAPSRQPDLWDKQVLQKFYNNLEKGGYLVTYCAQGQFKRNLKSVGFTIEELPGPPGRREMTRAMKF